MYPDSKPFNRKSKPKSFSPIRFFPICLRTLNPQKSKSIFLLLISLSLIFSGISIFPNRHDLSKNPKPPKQYCYDSDSDDPYASDHFRMYEFKIRRCTRSRSHDWTDCPFSHPGEKACRRDPRRYHYTGEVALSFVTTVIAAAATNVTLLTAFSSVGSIRVVTVRKPSLSPPLSPADKAAAFSRLSRLRTTATESVTYRELLNDMISSLDSVSLTGALEVADVSEVLIRNRSDAEKAVSELAGVLKERVLKRRKIDLG